MQSANRDLPVFLRLALKASRMDGGGGRNRTGVYGFAIRCITILLPRRIVKNQKPKNNGKAKAFPEKFGAGNETRTRDLYLGKVSLYQLSYSRKKRSAYYMCIKSSVKKNGMFSRDASRARIRPRIGHRCIMRGNTSRHTLSLKQSCSFRPGGEIGRHNGLKIRRMGKTSVPVRFRFRAPYIWLSSHAGIKFYPACMAKLSPRQPIPTLRPLGLSGVARMMKNDPRNNDLV
jgi:hypothetical protein